MRTILKCDFHAQGGILTPSRIGGMDRGLAKAQSRVLWAIRSLPV